MSDIEINIEQLTKEILQLKKQTIKNMFEIGKKLIEVKKQLPHGQFGKYIEEKVEFSRRSANNYIRVVEEFSNSQTFANLEPSKLVILLDVPKNKLDNFEKENDLENMSCREIKGKIKELKKNSIKKSKKEKEKIRDEPVNTSESEDDSSNYDEDGSFNPFKNASSSKSWFENFDFESFFKQHKPIGLIEPSPEEKKTLKKFYNILAKQVHPDKGGTNEDMCVLNKIKESWDI